MKHGSTIVGAIMLTIVALLILAWATWSIGLWWALAVIAVSFLITAFIVIGIVLLVSDPKDKHEL